MHRAATQSISNTTFTYVAYDTVDYDPNGNLTTGTNASYTCPVNGYYALTSTVTFATMSGLAYTTFWKNGAVYAGNAEDSVQVTTAEPALSISDQIQCVAGDILAVVAYQGSGGSLNIDAGSFAVHFLSPS